jgi:hypothetical protein
VWRRQFPAGSEIERNKGQDVLLDRLLPLKASSITPEKFYHKGDKNDGEEVGGSCVAKGGFVWLVGFDFLPMESARAFGY